MLSLVVLLFAIFTAHGFTPSKAPQRMVHLYASKTNQRLEELGITLPPAPAAAANYLPCQRSGNMLYLSGHMPLLEDGTILTGVCSSEEDVEKGYQAARQVGLNLIATINKELDGDLDRVEQVIKLFGIVQSTPDFHFQHKVLNGCSDLMGEVFGERGIHSRSAIGTNALPLDLMVEIEAIVRFRE
jgi:enamine deaminase RidA (YjgF/YER057c/UK114 family)